MVADIPKDGVPAFQQYEAHVLPLLSRYGGRLDRRMRSHDQLSEVHIVSFETRTGYDSYIADPERQRSRDLLDGIDVAQRLIQVSDV